QMALIVKRRELEGLRKVQPTPIPVKADVALVEAAKEAMKKAEQDASKAHEALIRARKEFEDLKNMPPAPTVVSSSASEVERLRTSTQELAAHLKKEAAWASAAEAEVRTVHEEVTTLLVEKHASLSS